MDIVQPRSYKHAPVSERIIARIIDEGVLLLWSGVVISGLRMVTIPTELHFVGIYVVTGVLYNFLLVWWVGATAGKQVMRMRVVTRVYDSPDGKTAFLRECIGKLCSTLPFGLGFMWAFSDAHQQTWHDKLAKTYVVKTRAGELIRIIDENTYSTVSISEQPNQATPPNFPS